MVPRGAIPDDPAMRTGPGADPSIRLRIATRIHFALLRRFDENVAVATLLDGGPKAQEALWVCQASGDPELRNLALQLGAATEAAADDSDAERFAGHAAPQDAVWARNTTGFGVTRPLALAEAMPAMAEPGWRHPLRWLRGQRTPV
jgi:hypothetical protein